MVWKVTTEPAAEPVSLSEAKLFLRIDDSSRDEEILSAIMGARQYIEKITNRALLAQTWRIDLAGFGAGATLFPANVRSINGVLYKGSSMSQWTNEPTFLPPNVTAINSVTYYDYQNAQQTLVADVDYLASLTEPAQIVPVLYWPLTYRRPDAVQISVDVGYANAGSVPEPIKTAIKFEVQRQLDRPIGPELDAISRARDSMLAAYIDGGLLI